MASPFSAPWPDPNSPVLSKIDFGVPLVELFKWLDVRDDTLSYEHGITKAVALARNCKHPDAEWLVSVFEGKDVSTEAEVKKVLLSHQTDARSLCFAWFLSDDREKDLPLLRRAAEMGNAFACSTLCREVKKENGEEAFRLAQLAAAQRERDGFFELGSCFYRGVGCDRNLNMAKENLLVAAELGHVEAGSWLSNILDECDPARMIWSVKVALRGIPNSFLDSFANQVEQFFSGSGNSSIVFLIGHALKGNIDMEKQLIFGRPFVFDSLLGPANQAVSFYDSQIKSARLAVDTWTLVATQLHLIKDMRIYIGKMIWEARFEANYEFYLDDDASSSSYSSSRSALSSQASSPVPKRSRK